MKRLLWMLFWGCALLHAPGQISHVSFGPHVAVTAGDSPIQCAVADMDRDGRPDLVVANHLDSRLMVYRNVGTGMTISASTFAAPEIFATGSMPHDMAVGDIDGDGWLDVVTGNLGDHTVSLLRNTSATGVIQFAMRTDIPSGGQIPHGVALSDVDNDARPDLLVACYGSRSTSLFRNMGSGVSAATFPQPLILHIGDGPHTIAAGDLTGDGRPEVLVSNFDTPDLAILRHVPGVTAAVTPFQTNNFVEILRLPRGGNALHLGDIDGDGRTDVAVGHWRTQRLAVFRNGNPAGALLSFDQPVDLSVGNNIHSVVVRDLDADSRPELVTVGELSSYMSVFKNLASPGAIVPQSFAARVDFPSGWNANGLTVGDIQGDGRPEIVFANAYDDNIFIYQNRAGETNVAQPPVFVEQPQSQTVEAGSSVTFTVGVTGTQPFGYRWRRNGVTIANSNTDSLTIQNVQPSHAGVYTVVVTNPANPAPGVVSAPATLTVIGGTNVVAPTITRHPQSQTVEPGATVTFSVEATGTQPLIYRWRRNGVSLPGSVGPVLTLNGVTPEHAGFYSVIVSNIAGARISSNALLRVITPTNPPPPATFAFAEPMTFAGGDSPVACAYADLENDGQPDLVVINYLSSTLSTYRNRSTAGSIQFAPAVSFPTGRGPIAMAVQEVIGGGGLDIVTANYDTNTVSVFINSSTPTNINFMQPMHLSTGPGGRPRGVAVGDVDGDGAGDIVVAAMDSDTLTLFRNRAQIGATFFDFPFFINIGNGPTAVTVTDIDADGRLDIVVACHETSELVILRRNGLASPDGRFNSAMWDAPVRFPRGGVDVIARDVDGDSRLDLLVGDWRGHILSVFRNSSVPGTIALNSPVDLNTGNHFHHVDTGDLDADGKPELVAVGEMASYMSIFKNLSTAGSLTPASFSGRVDFPSGWNPHGAVVADVDDDNRPDITFANAYDDTITIYRNTFGATNVIEPPRIVVQPQSQTVPVGGTALFHVEVTGTPPFGYRWRRNGITIAPPPGSDTLIISNVQPSHAGNYSVVVTNPATMVGVLSSNAVLTVIGSTNGSTPVIANFTPRSGPTGTVVTIFGGNFHPTVGGNRVYFGDAQARVLNASINVLTVEVPVGATYEPISVNTGNRVAFSDLPFVVTFASPRTIHSGSFSSFNLPAGDLPMNVSIADMEGNGKLDLVAMNYQGSTVGVYLNQSTTSTLQPEHFESPRIYPTGPLPYHMVLADIDGAGGADIVTANRGDNTVSLFRNMPAGVFALSPPVHFPVGQTPVGLATGDLDKDGRVDIVTANQDGDSITILRQVNNPFLDAATPPFQVLELPVGDGPHNVVIADIDGDSRPDIAVANYHANSMSIFRNLTTGPGIGPGSFAPEVTFAPGGNCIAFGDLDGDGRGDLAIAEWNSQVLALYRNVSSPGTIALSGPATFAIGNLPYTITLSDLDGDARVDLSIVGQLPSFMGIFKNQASPGSLNTNSFAPRVDFPSGWNAVGLDAGDLNGDGRPDLVFANAYDDNLTVYVNEITGANTNVPTLLITEQPQSQTVQVGGTAIFHVGVSGTPPSGYRWRRNGITIAPPPGSDTLIISNVQPSHAGVYSVVVTNAANPAPGLLSSNAVLTVIPGTNAPPAPLIGIAHTWRYDQSGADLSGTFAAPGFDDSSWPQGPGVLGVENAPLPAPISTPLTLGQVTYYFRTTLNLTEPQLNSISQFYINTLIDDGAVVYVNGNEVFRLRMQSGPITGNTFAQGVVGDAMMEGPFYIPRDQFVPGQNTIAVEVHQINLASSDIVFGVMLHGVTIETNVPPPIITEQPQSQTVNVGGTATFHVEATGVGPLAYRWRRNGVNIPDANTDTLVLSNVQLSDAGVYTVVVSNAGSPAPGVISAPATLTVIGEPPPPGAAPVITRIHPTSGPVGTELAIQGTRLVAETNGTPRVRVGGLLADVLSASPTQLVVRVPAGAMYSPVTVTVSRRTAYSHDRFDVTFPAVERIRSRHFSGPVHLPSGPIPIHMAAGDIDGDSYTDLVVANRDGANFTVFRNRGAEGGFHAGVHFEAGHTPYQLAIGDLNGDGLLDVVTADAISDTVSVHRNVSSSGNVSFAPRVASPAGDRPLSIAIGDLNRDGFLDVVTGDYDDQAISVFLGADGSGALLPRVTYPTGGDPHAVVIGDVSGDGYPDVVVPNYQSGTVALLRGTAAGILAPRLLFNGGGNTIALANVDFDDDLDLVVGNYQGSEVRVFDNVGFHTTNQFFAPASFPAGTTPHQVAVGDLDGDGRPDIAAAGEYPSQIGLLQNGSTWSLGTVFGPPELLVGQANETGVVIADFDKDGRPDVAVANAYSSTISWFRNNIPETEPPVEPPQIITQPPSQTVPVGGTAIFTVVVTGTPPLSYEWRFGGTLIPNSNTNRLIIANVQPGHAGDYTVRIRNEADPIGVISSTARLTVTPTNQIPAGNLVSISNVWRYEASGTNLGTSWLNPNFNDETWPTGPALLGFETSPLPFPIQTTLPIGPITYYFRTELNLNVPAINPFAQFRLRTLVDDGAVVYINGTEAVRVGMPPGPITYNTLATRSAEAVFEGPFLIPPSLFVPGRNVIAVEVHQGQVASGDVVFGVTLEGQPEGTNVVHRPMITEHPQSQTVEVGGTAIFHVGVTGTPPFGYRWRRNGVTIAPPPGSATLIISNVQSSHAGTYNVVVTNAASLVGVLSSNAVLTVIGQTNALPPQITQQPQSQTAPVGGTATFSVQTSGTLPIRYQWLKGDVELGSATNRVLTLTNVQTNHAGVYLVRVSNSAGTVTSQPATLTVTPPEPGVLPPVIAGFTPQSGPTGTLVRIVGDHFHPSVGGNQVFFGAMRARVLTATTNEITAEAPVGATYEPISVNTRNRVAFSDRPFVVTFESSRRINAGSFHPFTVTAGDSPVHVSMGDMEGNGMLDFVAANLYSSTVGVYLNRGTNSVLDPVSVGFPRIYPTGPAPFFMALADIDGSGSRDVITANTENHTISLIPNVPAGVFALATPLHLTTGQLPIALATGDLDKDGRLDIVVANHDSDSITIFRQVFSPFPAPPAMPFQAVELPVGDGPHNVVIGDVDGDGRVDIIVANFQTRTMALLRNLSTGPGISTASFAPAVHFPRGGNCLAFGDLDGDGKNDIVIGNWRTQTLSVFRNVASPGAITLDSLAAPVDFAMGNNPHTIALSDLDGDARVEIAVVGELSSYMSIFKNVSTPGTLNENSFLPRVDFSSGWNAIGIAAGDLDGDSRPELVFANAYDDNLTIYRNRTAEIGTNGPPVANLAVESAAAVQFLSDANERVIIDPLHTGVVVQLDGTSCSDAEGDLLRYEWSVNGHVISTSVSTSHTFTLGSHVVTLRVSDGTRTASTSTTIAVITPVEAVETLIALIQASDLPARPKQRLVAILEDTLTIIPHDLLRADTRLEKAQHKIRLALRRENPALAGLIVDALEQIICGSRCD